jgi:hypothetical protein
MATRINAQDAHRRAESGAQLVCAYEDDAKCEKIALGNSISLKGLESRAAGLPKTQELIFYCA